MADETTMGIQLSESMVEQALPKVAPGLRKYVWLQSELHQRDVSTDPDYRRRFNGFYRVRRGQAWQEFFFRMLERDKVARPSLRETLLELHAGTGRVEASFASKLLATIDPHQPVIDSVVLANLGLRIRNLGSVGARVECIVAVHQSMAAQFAETLTTREGHYLVTRFRKEYPGTQLSEEKMLDLVLWQTRTAA